MNDILFNTPSTIVLNDQPLSRKNELFKLSYSTSTTSSVIAEISHIQDIEAEPLFIADEYSEFFELSSKIVSEVALETKCKAYDISPWDVSDILTSVNHPHTYDTLCATDLVKAFNADRVQFLYLASRKK